MNSITGTIIASTTTVETTAVAIPTTALSGRRTLLVLNNGTATVYLGASDVTVAAGYPLEAGSEKGFDLAEGCVLYGISESSVDVRTFEGA